jgi:hypothetical protein
MRRLLALLPLLLTACAVAVPLGGGAGPQAVPVGPVAAPAELMFPECQGVELAFQGETTLAALGLDEALGGGPDASKVGLIWVTAGPVEMDVIPMPVGKGELPPAQRMVCVQWPDGSGMMSQVDDTWQPPSILDGGDGGALSAGGSGPPLGLVALVIGAVVLIGVSVVAFRREGA